MRGLFIKLVGNKVKEEFKPENVKTIFIGGGRIGDIIVKTPMLEALSKLNSEVKIDISVVKGGESLVENIPYINKVIVGDSYLKKNKISKIVDSLKSSFQNRKKYDLYFDFTNNCRFFHILSLRILSPRYLIGRYRLEKFGIKRDELSLYDKYVQVSEDAHAVDINMDYLEPIGLDKEGRKYKLYLGNNEDKFKDYFDSAKINIIVNHRASVQKRSLNYDELKEVLLKTSKLDSNIKIYLATMPNEYIALKDILDSLALENVELLPRTESVGELAGIIKYCDMVLSVDTGVVHIASVYDKPIVGIYPTNQDNFKLFTPRSSKYSIVRGSVPGNTIEGFNIDETVLKIEEFVKEKRAI
ncbi:MAG: glycosyltransferase family 9 protein [Cetobacterium sp.]